MNYQFNVNQVKTFQTTDGYGFFCEFFLNNIKLANIIYDPDNQKNKFIWIDKNSTFFQHYPLLITKIYRLLSIIGFKNNSLADRVEPCLSIINMVNEKLTQNNNQYLIGIEK